MQSFSATLAWATPVPAEKLGAHVEAYLNMQPTITTLRLCHRFSTTSGISKLPVELLSYIEELLTDVERQNTTKNWTTNLRCLELRCEPEDHLAEDALDEIWEKIADGELAEEEDPQALDWDMEMRVYMYLDRHDDLWIDEHYKRQNRFEDLAGYKTCRPNEGIFCKNATLLRKILGLDIWTTYVRLSEAPVDNRWNWIGANFFPAETFITYLIMPGARSQDKRYWPAEIEGDDTEMANEDGAAMQVLPPKLPKGARKRFERALKILEAEARSP